MIVSTKSTEQTLVRPALGEAASLGALYDARTDSFVQFSIIKNRPNPKAITTIDIHDSDIKYTSHDSFKDKFSNLDISAKLGASFLAGLVTVEGSGKYLSERRDTNLVAQRSLIYNIKTKSEKLDFQTKEVEDNISWEAVDAGAATHVVSEIAWGSRNIVTAKQTFSNKKNAKTIDGALDARLAFWRTFKLSGQGQASFSEAAQSADKSLEITVFGDVLANDGVVPTDLTSANHFLQNVQKYISSANGGKGKPITYKLMPLSLLAKILNHETSIPLAIERSETESSGKFVQLFDDLAFVRQELGDYRTFLQQHRDYVPSEHVRAVGDKISEVKNIENVLQRDYARKLQAIRSGSTDKIELWQLLEEFGVGNSKVHQLAAITTGNFKEKIRFVDGLVKRGVKYIGFNGDSLDLELGANPDDDIHVFHFSEAAKVHTELWKQNLAVLYRIMNDTVRQPHVILKDHDAFDEELAIPRIELIRKAEVIVADVLEDHKASSKKSYARYDEKHLDSGRPKPLRRVAMKISCPKIDCIPSAKQDWICTRCNGLIEYGHINEFLYCDCGRCEYKWWSFRCSNSKHGLNFETYEEPRFLQRLKALEPFEELNILILGATGVGKSTWVNAFVNYLSYPTLDDALEAEKLCWIIPFAFSTYSKRADGEFEKMKVSFGFEKQSADESMAQKVSIEEHDGTNGGSATQHATVHRVQIGKRLVKLIDTPGVGDTRGAGQDKKNMADILSVLRTYNKLHGILILLKPNEQRLGIMFRFCIQELLTHLHRDAAQNIAFGFTNTRGTSYTPGDTFDPLQKLLEQYKEVDIALRQRNVYCFDSESFRYLAAQKQYNKSLGHFEETRSSWEYSVGESKRLLDYFQTIPPHEVNSTVNLYETRHRVVQMTEPMAEIAETMKTTIMVNEDLVKELERRDMTKKELEEQLKIQVNTLIAVPVDRPRTACAHVDCVEYENTGLIGKDGKPTLGTVHKSLCHSPCYLNNIAVDKVGVAGLRDCSAMKRDQTCRRCTHPVDTHLHIRHEWAQGTMEMDDPSVVAALESNASHCENQKTVIASKKKLVEELELELKKIRDATAQFSIFLQRNAIVPINDATLAYLDQQIEQEQRKIQAGGSRDKYDRLTEYRRQYEQEVATLTEYMNKGENHMLLDQAGVEKLVQELYLLPQYGAQFRRVKEVVDESQVVVHREKPHIMQAKAHWTNKESSKRPEKPAAPEKTETQEKKGISFGAVGRWAMKKLWG
jgi:predicted GTPase